MNNITLMEKINELTTQYLATREQSLKVMVQVAIIRKAFGVKNNETNEPVRDYVREIVLSDDDIRKEFNDYLRYWNWAKENNSYLETEYKNQLTYFILAVRFFNNELSIEFSKVIAFR